ncbi:unnamed protein product [Brassica rapa]|uniref:Uncharacterized protein n=1 Tax=Brassica campestris TaxID=3711 RepID=A0A8D9HVE6_BRACM|nr:unnamed protein product [Brassica rapa]
MCFLNKYQVLFEFVFLLLIIQNVCNQFQFSWECCLQYLHMFYVFPLFDFCNDRLAVYL